jgi:hypothetical protein
VYQLALGRTGLFPVTNLRVWYLKLEAQLQGQLLRFDFGYHIAIKGFRRFLVSPPGPNNRERVSAMTRIAVPNSTGRRRSGRFGRWFTILLLLILVGTGLWTWLTLAWAYAEGERAGVLQKFVRRGWICKTQEGEMALYYGGGQYLGPGSSPQLWNFSVRDKAVGEQLNKAVGRRVQLHYTEHPGIPTNCFADTRYLVDKVTITDNEAGAGPALPPVTAPPGALPATPPTPTR